MSEPNEVRVTLTQQQGYAFLVDFGDDIADLLTDEPAPLGAGSGPNPSRLLLAAIANCLSASLVFALRKFKNQPEPIRAVAVVEKARNAERRMRISRIGVDLHLGAPSAGMQMLDRALAQFEDFCVVTQSVRAGIAVDVRVLDADGTLLKQG